MSGIKYTITIGPPNNVTEQIGISMHEDRPELVERIRKVVREYFKEQVQTSAGEKQEQANG